MLVHPDSIVFTECGIKRAGDLAPGDQLVGLDAEPTVAVSAVRQFDGDHDLIMINSKHRHLTTRPSTKLLMLRRKPVESYPPRSGWWTEEHPIADLMEKCSPHSADCSITSCWCLQHKRHFVVLNRLGAHRLNFAPKCKVGHEGKPHRTMFDTHEDATRARFDHIAHGHVVSPVHETPQGHVIHVARTNTRARQIHEWGIVPALPGRQFSVERVRTITPCAGPLVEIDVPEPVVIEAMVVCP